MNLLHMSLTVILELISTRSCKTPNFSCLFFFDTSVHILINNAAQTIIRPVAYYRTLIEQEGLLHCSNHFAAKFMVKAINQDPFLVENLKHKNSTEKIDQFLLNMN
jgi:hypothetical protein